MECLLSCLLSLLLAQRTYAGCSTSATDACSAGCPRVSVKYGSTEVTCNMLLNKALAKSAPTVKLSSVDQKKKYIILMVDPDAPESTKGNGWVHWIAETSGKQLSSGAIQKQYLEYAPPTPPSGTHRYIFYIIDWTKSKHIESVKSRGKFGYANFISRHGTLRASNMFRASA